MIRMGVDLFC